MCNQQKNKGKFITIEGVDGSGKSTLAHWLVSYLKSCNIPTIFTREPGGTPVAEHIRNIAFKNFDELKKTDEPVFAETELLLMFAARYQHLHHMIIPKLNEGLWVVSDRFIDSSYAYQGGGRGLDIGAIANLEKLVVKQMPDMTLFMNIPLHTAIERNRISGRYEDDNQLEGKQEERTLFFNKVDSAFKKRAIEDSQRIKIIEYAPLLEQQEQVKSLLEPWIFPQIDPRQTSLF